MSSGYVTKSHHRAMLDASRSKVSALEAELAATRAELADVRAIRATRESGTPMRGGKTLATLEQAQAVLSRLLELAAKLDENRGTKHIARRIVTIVGMVGERP